MNDPKKHKKNKNEESLNKIGDVVDIWKLIREKGMKIKDRR